jgi:hypothetical protein
LTDLLELKLNSGHIHAVLRAMLLLAGPGCWLTGADLQGVVRFSGLPVPGASVTASQNGRRVSAVTGVDGLYRITGLGSGSWTVRVEMPCFRAPERTVELSTDPASIDWQMEALPGCGTATAQPPPAATPPAAASPPPAVTDPSALDLAEGILVNGSARNAADSPLALSAAFGNFRGASARPFNFAVKFSLGDSVWDARPFSLTGQSTPRPDYQRWSAELIAGGQWVQRRLWSEARTPWVFVNYERQRETNATTANGLMPSQQARQGDFSQALTPGGQPLTLLDPTTSQPFPGNQIPLSRRNQAGFELLSLYPAPRFATAAGYNFQQALVRGSHEDRVRAGWQQSIAPKVSFSIDGSLRGLRADDTNLFGFLDNGRNSSRELNLAGNYRPSSRLQFRAGVHYASQSAETLPYFANTQDIAQRIGLQGASDRPEDWGPPSLQFARGLTPLTDAISAHTRARQTGVNASGSFTRARHELTFGADWFRRHRAELGLPNGRGAFSFTGAATGLDVADLWLGLPAAASVTLGQADRYFRSSTASAYVSDRWRVGSGLSATLGLRWEFTGAESESQGRLTNLDLGPGFTSAASVTGQQTGSFPAALVRSFPRLLEPRLAVAWRPGVGSLVVRAGYGLYADTGTYSPLTNGMAWQGPFLRNLSVAAAPQSPLALESALLTPTTDTGARFAADPGARPGVAHQWQLSVQRDLPAGLVWTGSYLGIQGNHARQSFLPNTAPPGLAPACDACPRNFLYVATTGHSTRHAAQLQLRRRLLRGSSASVQYVFSKSIDDVTPGGENRTDLLTQAAQNWRDLRSERGLSAFDERHLLTAQFQWQSPLEPRRGAWNLALRSWRITGQITAGSGHPQSPLYFDVLRGTGIVGNLRPDYTGAPANAAERPGPNPRAFAAPSAGQWGNAGRNSIAGPHRLVLSAALQRDLRLPGTRSAFARLESDNPWNAVTYQAWNVMVPGAQFGYPSSANPMRRMRLRLEAQF